MRAATKFFRRTARVELGLSATLTMAMALPMLILYALGTLGPFLIRDLHIEAGWLGYVTMSAFGLAAVLSLGAGPLVERLGSRRGLCMLFAAVALAYAAILAVPGFGGVIVAVAICGVAQALSNPVTNLLIAQRVAPEKKALIVGLKQSGVQIGALFAGLALPGLAAHYGWRAALGLIAPVSLLMCLLSPLSAPAPARRATQAKGRAALRPNGLLWRLMGVQGCVGMALSSFVTFLPLFATLHGTTPAQAGLMVATFGATGIFSRVVLTPLGARLKDESQLLLALLAFAALAVGITMCSDSTTHWMLWAGAAGMGLTAVATNAIAMGMLLRDPIFGGAATASGLLSAAFFGGFAVGPPLCGAVINSRYGFSGAWTLAIAVLMAGCAIALSLARVRARRDR